MILKYQTFLLSFCGLASFGVVTKLVALGTALLVLFAIPVSITLPIFKLYEETTNEEESVYNLFFKGVKENNLKLENPEVTLFMIIELVSSTCFNSILYKQPLPIEEYKPYLYDTIRSLIKEK